MRQLSDAVRVAVGSNAVVEVGTAAASGCVGLAMSCDALCTAPVAKYAVPAFSVEVRLLRPPLACPRAPNARARAMRARGMLTGMLWYPPSTRTPALRAPLKPWLIH